MRPTYFRKEPLVMPEKGELRLGTRADQETRELPLYTGEAAKVAAGILEQAVR